MPQPPAPPFWTINHSSGGANGGGLVGCHIGQSGGTYTFYKPNWDVLATFSGTTLSCSFNYNGVNGWTVTLVNAVPGSNANGGWRTPDTGLEDIPAQSGDYMAQTGGGFVVDQAASSAGHGKG
jgi:hypothetical protein